MDIQYTTPDGQDKPSPSITPEMIEAGVKALNDAEADNWMPDRYSAVAAIYAAMRLLDRG